MQTGDDGPFTMVFVGHAAEDRRGAAVAYEDAVLPLLAEHGARLLYRGRRAAGEDEALPLEVHVIWFPGRGAYEAYLGDARRGALLREHGEVFARKQAVTMETVAGGEWEGT